MSDDLSEGSTYRPIGEVANLLRLQPHVLRFWETKFKQIAPLKRSGGRRYYRREDVRILFQIRDILYVEGYTLRGAQKALAERARAEKNALRTERSYNEKPPIVNSPVNSPADSPADSPSRDAELPPSSPPPQALNPAVRRELQGIAKKLEETLKQCSAEETTMEEAAQENSQKNTEESQEETSSREQ